VSVSAPRRSIVRAARRLVTVALALGLAAWPRDAAAQTLERAARFTITAVSDSTFTFAVGSARWVKAGERGMAVDPKRRDALVARFQVLAVGERSATALITGETTPLTPDHVAVLEMPIRPWYSSSLFWSGAVLGLLGGLFVGSR
jgi:hypothetical protein